MDPHEAMELPPNNPEGDASLPIPASFEFQNGQLEEIFFTTDVSVGVGDDDDDGFRENMMDG